MKKLYIAALAASLSASAYSDVTVYGSAEQAITSQGGVADISTGDNYIGFRAGEDLGNGDNAFAVIELGVSPEDTNTMSTRESYVGLNLSGVRVAGGKMPNAEKAFVNGHVDIFEGTSMSTEDQTRDNNAASITTDIAGVTVSAGTMMDGSTGEKTVDTHSIAAKTTMGPVSVSGVYAMNNVTGADTVVVGGTADLGVAKVGATYEPDADRGDTVSVVASTDIGNNTLSVGHQNVDGGNNTNIAEVKHNFTKMTSAYVNISEVENSDSIAMVGMRIKF